MISLDLDFRILTPMYMGDAGQRAALRAASIKGALRWWYRALDPAFSNPDHLGLAPEAAGLAKLPSREQLLFGGTKNGAGQSRFLLRTNISDVHPYSWQPQRARRFTEGYGRNARNGLVYLGYTFQLRGNENRTAIPAGSRFHLRVVSPRPPTEAPHRRAILGSLWLLGALGSLGTRSRRGFGSLQVEWPTGASEIVGRLTKEWSADLSVLPNMGACSDPASWTTDFDSGLARLREWFGPFSSNASHPNLGDRFRYVLIRRGFAGPDAWETALNHAGRLLQDFRQRAKPDYDQVRAYASSRRPLRCAPERATFGLPLAFRFGSIRAGPTTFVPSGVEFRSNDFERHASLLLVKLVDLGGRLHPLFIRMSGAVPGVRPQAAIRRGGHSGVRLDLPKDNAMDAFMDSLNRERA